MMRLGAPVSKNTAEQTIISKRLEAVENIIEENKNMVEQKFSEIQS